MREESAPADAGRTPFGIAVALGAAAMALAALLFDGFFANRYRELTWEGTTSLWHLTAFVLAVGIGLGQRWIRRARDSHAMDNEFDDVVENTETRMKESHGG